MAGLSQLSILTLFIGSEWQTEHLWSDGGAFTPFARRWRTRVANSRTRQGSKEEQGQMYHRTRSRGRWRLRLRKKYLHHYYFTTYQNPDFLSNVNQAKKYTLEATSGIKFTVSQRIVKPDWLVVVSLPTNHYHTNFFVVSREEEALLYATAGSSTKKLAPNFCVYLDQ